MSNQLYLMQLNNFGKTTADVTLLFTWAVSDIFFSWLLLLQYVGFKYFCIFVEELSAKSLLCAFRILLEDFLNLLVITSIQR